MRSYWKIGLVVAMLITLVLVAISKETPPPFVEMEVKGVRLDATGQNPVVVLADREGNKALPIWIGIPEATAIERELKNIAPVRPMTHDLLYSILAQAQINVKEVRIVDLKDRTYYAKLFLTLNKKLVEVDARPSDAIVIALKSKAPIFVSAAILDEQGIALAKKSMAERYGIRVQELTSSLSSHFGFEGEKGVLVSEVLPGSASEASGIKAGDIITRVNAKEVSNVQEFEEALDAIKVGRPVRVTFFRDDKLQEVTFVVAP
ncbi:MAG: bifunctional nuclease family protein [Syntrophaceae bacterium]|nr:bifunctional nuclease family protein [Syntrophaceae bacterium]